MTEYIPGDTSDDIKQEPVDHYQVRTLVLGLRTVGLANEFYRISATSEPPDPRFMGHLYDTAGTGSSSAMFGDSDPEALFDAEDYEHAIEIARKTSSAALTLTEHDYPLLRIRLDPDLAVHARDILLGIEGNSPQQHLF